VQKKIIVFVIIVVLFYASLAIISDISKVVENFEQINLIYLPVMILLLLTVIIFRTLLQKFLLRKISIEVSFKFSFQLFLAGLSMIVTPAGTGQIIKSHLLKEKLGVPIKKTLPIVLMERFFDLAAIAIIVTLTLLHYNSFESLILVIISVVVLTILSIFIKNRKLFNYFIKKLNKIKFFETYLSENKLLDNSLNILFSPHIIIKGVFITIPIILLEGLIIYFGFLSFDTDFGYIQTVQFFYTSILAGTFSFIPGGLGVMEGNLTAILLLEGVPISLSSSITIFVRLLTIWFATTIGFIFTYIVIKHK
jgi:glycosyltransferase 2 family protein